MAHQRYNPSALDNPKVSIVIPVYNEKSTIDEILRRVLDTPVRKEVIIVDDCSTDGRRMAKHPHRRRMGATKWSCEI
jgi:cellulose synthase/poly-beta-1,6-N-acetylglucosamine synthase-like glycosyltransferase